MTGDIPRIPHADDNRRSHPSHENVELTREEAIRRGYMEEGPDDGPHPDLTKDAGPEEEDQVVSDWTEGESSDNSTIKSVSFSSGVSINTLIINL